MDASRNFACASNKSVCVQVGKSLCDTADVIPNCRRICHHIVPCTLLVSSLRPLAWSKDPFLSSGPSILYDALPPCDHFNYSTSLKCFEYNWSNDSLTKLIFLALNLAHVDWRNVTWPVSLWYAIKNVVLPPPAWVAPNTIGGPDSGMTHWFLCAM